ncbi:MAG: hypothetical protein FJ119_05280 [Deltaproteobacteria bacterium]|nr:hypothetical protein [Deltaproteobacteria bacterium]
MKKTLILACLVIFMATGTALASKLIQLSLTPDIAIHSRTTRIEGLSLNIWGENPQSSFALGIVNGFTGTSKGFALGFLNYSDSYKGFQFAGVNYTNGSMLGGQLGVVNYVEHLKGVQIGIINYAASATTGFQLGILNVIPKNQWFRAFPNQIAPGMVIVNWRF